MHFTQLIHWTYSAGFVFVLFCPDARVRCKATLFWEKVANFVSGFMILFNLYPLNKLSGSSTCLKYSSWRFVVLDHLHSLMNKSNPCQHIKSNKRFSKLIYTQITIHFIHTCTHIFTVPLSVSLANAKIS